MIKRLTFSHLIYIIYEHLIPINEHLISIYEHLISIFKDKYLPLTSHIQCFLLKGGTYYDRQ